MSRDPVYRTQSSEDFSSLPATVVTPEGVIRMGEDIFMKRPGFPIPASLLRTRSDSFYVTPAGGLFHSSIDPNIKIYFPVNAINTFMTISMQVGFLTYNEYASLENNLVDWSY